MTRLKLAPDPSTMRPMKHARRVMVSLLAMLVLCPMAWAAQHAFYFGDPGGRDVVTFTSDAPLELITGQTNQITGKVIYDESFVFDAKHPFDIEFSVDLNSVKTGIELRDQHMRDGYLETDKYPKATFKATHIKTNAKPPFSNGQVVEVVATGPFTVHGKTVTKTIPLKVTYFPESKITKSRFKSGNIIRIQGEFPVSLNEHGVKRPTLFAQKLAETVFVKIDAFGTDDPKALE